MKVEPQNGFHLFCVKIWRLGKKVLSLQHEYEEAGEIR